MSLLRRLTEQAQQVKDAEAAQERARADRKDRFNQVTIPALQGLAAFLTEITDQIKVVRPPLQQSFDLPGYGVFTSLNLYDFAVKLDTRYSEVHLELTWKSRIDTERAPRLVLNSFDRIRSLAETFKRLHFGGFKDERRGPGGHVIACTLQVTGFVHSRMHVVASLEEEQARFTFENIDQLVQTRQSIPVELLSDEVCERLGEFLLRENDIFIRETWVRGLKRPAQPLRPPKTDERAVVALNEAAPLASSGPEPAKLNIESGFSRASAQKQDRDLDLMAELSEAARLAEAVVQQTLASASLDEYSTERQLGAAPGKSQVLSSAAGLAEQHRAAPPRVTAPAPTPTAAPAAPTPPVAAAPAAPLAPTPAAAPVRTATVPAPVPVSPAATATTPAQPAPAPTARRSDPVSPVLPPAPAAPAARAQSAPQPHPAARVLPTSTTPAAPAAVQPGSPAAAQPAAPAASAAARPAVPAAPVPVAQNAVVPAAAPVATRPVPPAPVAARPAPAPTPPAPIPPVPPVVEPVPETPPAATAPGAAVPSGEGKPAVARGFMDRFEKMRSELERKS